MRYVPILLLVLPLAAGCLAVGYPSVRQTPAVVAPEPDVHVFRVIADDERHLDGPNQLPTERDHAFHVLASDGRPDAVKVGVQLTSCTIEEVPIENGEAPAKTDTYFAYYYLAVPFEGWRARSVSLRLYRRGYETVALESRPWLGPLGKAGAEKVKWKKADTLEAREKAIDDVGRWLLKRSSPAVNDFVADEYLALANGPLADRPEHRPARARLREKAKVAREGPTPKMLIEAKKKLEAKKKEGLAGK
jgi:hypothetical protein